ncbi:hypothetical protein [Flammeovirga sp. EKP202]|uniref:hypothetical protein n=1 Tax=Flammeovirga sp. EKP202 TaxID=2770592 RepID=UPI00165FDB40|nr:hypothetical protein [Flammeovirga sp. EKP202]MBD0402671.1 hypothetical protein [Flammeovirga sp. EKP202]
MKNPTVAYTWRKVIRWFYVYFVACFLIAVGNFSSFRQIEDHDAVLEKVLDIRQKSMRMTLAAQEFLSYEAHYEDFHKSREATPIMKEYHKIDKNLELYISSILTSNSSWKVEYETDLDSFFKLLKTHRKTFSKIITQLKYRGSQNSGMIGDLQKRTKALAIDPYINIVSLERMKLLEKSYLLSADTSEFYKIRELNHQMQNDIKNIPMAENHRYTLLNNLKRYNSTLLKIVNVDLTIGFRGDKGLTLNLQKNTEDIINLSQKMYNEAKKEKDDWLSYSRWLSVIFGTLSISVLLVLSLTSHELLGKMK